MVKIKDKYEALKQAIKSLKDVNRAYILIKTFRDKTVAYSIINNEIDSYKLEHTLDYSIELWRYVDGMCEKCEVSKDYYYKITND